MHSEWTLAELVLQSQSAAAARSDCRLFTGKLFAKNAASAFAGCFTFEDTTPDDADHKEFYLEKVELKQTGLATDKKKHYIHHLLRIFKDGGDATNSSPGWDKYEEQDEE